MEVVTVTSKHDASGNWLMKVGFEVVSFDKVVRRRGRRKGSENCIGRMNLINMKMREREREK